VYRLWRDKTLYQIWTQSSNQRRSYCAFNIWPNDLEHCVMCCARLWDDFHRDWPLTTYPCLNYSVFYADTLFHAVTLNIDPLMLEVRGICSGIIKVGVTRCGKLMVSPCLTTFFSRRRPRPLEPDDLFSYHPDITATHLSPFQRVFFSQVNYFIRVSPPGWCHPGRFPPVTSLRYIKRHVIKVCTKFERNRTIPGWVIDILRIFAHVMWHCNLDL